jgi:hypothetical protein
MFVLMGMIYAYGRLEGEIAAGRKNNNLNIVLRGGSQVSGVFLMKTSSGVVYKKVSDSNLFFVPDNEIVSLELLSFKPAH